MTPSDVMDLAYQGMRATLLVATPILMSALLVGLLVALFQAATQINEMTLTFIPKILAVFVTLAVAGPWILSVLENFTVQIFHSIPSMVL